MPSVYILEEPKHGIDIETARKFGEVVAVFGQGERRPSVFRPNEFGAAVLAGLERRGFDPDADFFLLTGSLVCVAVALGCVMTAWPRANLLIFSSIESCYVCRPLEAITVTQLKGHA